MQEFAFCTFGFEKTFKIQNKKLKKKWEQKRQRCWLFVENNNLTETGRSLADQKFKTTAVKGQNLHRNYIQDQAKDLTMAKKGSLSMNVVGLLSCISKAT